MTRATRGLAGLGILGLLTGSPTPTPALEVPIVLSQVIASGADEPSAVALGDIDQDGDPDVLVASSRDGAIAWYPSDGAGVFAGARPVTTAAGASDAVLGDVDRDGDLDVVWSAAQIHTVAWQANDGTGTFGPPQLLSTTTSRASALALADLDGDGSLDVLAAAAGDAEVVWFANDGSGTFGAAQLLASGATEASAVAAADLDRDGRPDVLWGAAGTATIAWHRNDGGGSFGSAQTIATAAAGVVSVEAADLDRDGDLDVLAASRFDNTIGWYPNSDGQGNFGPEQLVATVIFAASAVAADLDRDGDPDVLAGGKFSGVFWYENDGAGGFGPAHEIASGADGAAALQVGDLDRDGDPDVLAAFEFADQVVWYANLLDGASGLVRFEVVSLLDQAQVIAAADVDRDGDPDAIGARSISGAVLVSWNENDGAGGLGPTEELMTLPGGGVPVALAVADLDGNASIDFVLSMRYQTTLAWFANDGAGAFTARAVVDSFLSGEHPTVLRTGDLDRDGDLDLVAGSLARGLAWYENLDGSGSFGLAIPIASSLTSEPQLVLVDFDGDGDLDLLSADSTAGDLVWLANDGAGSFGPEELLAQGSGRLDVADFDRDGDLDVRLGSAWLEGCLGGVCAAHPVPSVDGLGVADLDLDGDLDLVGGPSGYSATALFWLDNVDGTFVKRILIPKRYDHVEFADIDRDGVPDLVGMPASGHGSWARGQLRPETDGDGIPDALDPCESFPNTLPLPLPFGPGDENGDGIPTECQCGDANQSGAHDNGDVLLAFGCVPGSPFPTPPALCAASLAFAETNNSSSYDGADITSIYGFVPGSMFPNAFPTSALTCARRPEGTPAPP